jgi:phospholipid/cholesterol/gamma-HCH transport system substrate-binding protein
VTGALADRAPEIAQTIVEARETLKVATAALKRIDKLAGSADTLLSEDGKPLVADLRRTIVTAEKTLARIDAVANAAQPGLETLNAETLPEANRLLRDLQDMTQQLGAVAAKLDEDPAGALIGGRTLPDYVPPKTDAPK